MDLTFPSSQWAGSLLCLDESEGVLFDCFNNGSGEVSSLIDVSATLGREMQNGERHSEIIHFDATQRRKEKMRQKSQDAPSVAERNPQPAAKPQPVPEPLPAPKVAANPVADASPALSKLSGAELERFLIDFVVEQTGYPPEMVELDADLEADLGIDSIKKAQLFGELAEQFAITVDASDESLSLDDFPTLEHVMRFLQSNSAATPPVATPASANGNPHANGNGDASHAATPPPAVTPIPAPSALASVDLESFLVDFVVEQTGYPPEMVELDADLEADLGIDSIKKAQLFGELAEQFAISVDVTDEDLSLDDFPTLRQVMEFLQSSGSQTPSAASSNAAVRTVLEEAEPNESREMESEESASSSLLAEDELETFLVNFVVEQTGYPPEMVELDADLEADLGIDSIKKAQMMGELAEQFAISVDVTDEDLSLDDFPTLRHVCRFLAAPGKAAV